MNSTLGVFPEAILEGKWSVWNCCSLPSYNTNPIKFPQKHKMENFKDKVKVPFRLIKRAVEAIVGPLVCKTTQFSDADSILDAKVCCGNSSCAR